MRFALLLKRSGKGLCNQEQIEKQGNGKRPCFFSGKAVARSKPIAEGRRDWIMRLHAREDVRHVTSALYGAPLCHALSQVCAARRSLCLAVAFKAFAARLFPHGHLTVEHGRGAARESAA